MQIEELQKERKELVVKTNMMEAAGAHPADLEDDYSRMQELDYALWEHDFGESLDALTAGSAPLPNQSDWMNQPAAKPNEFRI